MEAKSPVVGSRVPIFSPLPVVVELAFSPLGLLVSLQAPTKKPVAKVAILSAKADLILGINLLLLLRYAGA
jgi:hypothetical protein